MATEVVFESIHTGKQYKVVSRDAEAGTITLVGPHKMPFTEKYSKERFEEMGYRPKVVEVAAPPPPGAAPPPPSTVVVNA